MDYAGNLEEAMYKIAVVACRDGIVRASVGSMIPQEVFDLARKSVLDGIQCKFDIHPIKFSLHLNRILKSFFADAV